MRGRDDQDRSSRPTSPSDRYRFTTGERTAEARPSPPQHALRAFPLQDASQQQTTRVNGQPGTSMGHEDLRVSCDLRQAAPTAEVFLRQRPVTNVLAEYN